MRRGVGARSAFARIATTIADDIRRGALRSGDRLPSTRAMTRRLGVTRNTVVAAFDELAAQGWVVGRGARGTFVADDIVAVVAGGARRGLAARPGFALQPVAPVSSPVGPPELRYQLSAGVPDPRLVPRDALARAYRRALHARTSDAALSYADPRGSLRLRTAIAALVRATRGIPAGPEHVLITRGSQQALALASELLLRPGDTVAVEALGYAPAWRVFERCGARLAPVAVDAAGLVVDELAAVKARAVYVTPHHQYPTTVLMSPARRLALVAHARRARLAILEDDYDHEFHFDGRPVAPLAASDPTGQIVYLGSLSKLLAPGLRLGFVVAGERVIDNLANLRTIADRQGDHVLEQAIAELIEDGELERHARKARRIYAARRDALATALTRELAGVLSFELPPGGVTVWARVAPGIALDAWRTRARDHGIALAIGRDFDPAHRAHPFVRLAFARHDEAELADAIAHLRRALTVRSIVKQ